MKLVVTGAAGRLAEVLIPHLLTDPRIEHITGIDRRPQTFDHPRYRPVIADVLDADLERYLEGADALVHMAFVLMGGGLGARRLDREAVRTVNVTGTRKVFEAAVRQGVRHAVFVSSVAVYGAWPDNPPLIAEDSPLRPNPGFSYAEDKAAAETWLTDFETAHPGLRLARLRPHAILGPHAHALLARMLRQPFYPLTLNPRPLTQCVWEDDVAEAVRLALHSDARGAFNLAAQPAMSLYDMLGLVRRTRLPLSLPLAERLQRLAWRLTPAAGEPGWVGGLRYSLAVDSTRAEQLLGWRPARDLAACVRQAAFPT
ncbi:MAG: NAD-dependent epimerase/dehydratase family protein [Gammaproteobacteria bacterium]|jgi:UDP-glucose 4-epimerase